MKLYLLKYNKRTGNMRFSDILFTTFWLKNNISNAENNILGLLEAGQIPKELVIVDDYSGTGKELYQDSK